MGVAVRSKPAWDTWIPISCFSKEEGKPAVVLSEGPGGGTSVWSPRAVCPLAPCPQPPLECFQGPPLGHHGAVHTFFLMIPVSPLSRRLDSFSSRSFLSYLVLMSWISLSSSSSICFLVSSNSRSCCRTSSCAWLRVGKGERTCAEGRGGQAAVLRAWDEDKRTEAFLMKGKMSQLTEMEAKAPPASCLSRSGLKVFLLPSLPLPNNPTPCTFIWFISVLLGQGFSL